MPQLVFSEESKVDETTLRNTIRDVQVTDSIFVYNLLLKDGEVSVELKQSLLELICYYNHEDTLPEDLIEERWFSQSTVGRDRQRKTWKDSDLAETIFYEIEPKDSRAYCSIIRGMCKYHQVEKAWALYQEAQEKKIEIDIETYNSILQIGSFLKESNEMRWELIQEVLTSMARQTLKPNVATLNAVLATISTIGMYKLSRSYCLSILSEFKELGVVPSLGSWYYILTIFCRERGPVSHVLVDILNQIEGKEFKIQDLKDTFFFASAMEVCRNHLHDKDLAKRLDNILHTGSNYDLIGDSYRESIYYRHYFALLCQTEPLEKFMETYNLLVPNVYIPEPGIMEEILKAIDMNGALEFIPQMWSHMVIFDHTGRENLLNRILRMMIDNRPNESIATQIGLDEKFSNITWDIWTKIEEQQEGRTQKLTWTGSMLSDILELNCRSNNSERARLVFEKLDKNQHKILGAPHPLCLVSYSQLCINEKQPSRAIGALQYCVENGFNESNFIARNIAGSLTLDETQMSKIASLVGKDVLKKKN